MVNERPPASAPARGHVADPARSECCCGKDEAGEIALSLSGRFHVLLGLLDSWSSACSDCDTVARDSLAAARAAAERGLKASLHLHDCGDRKSEDLQG